MKFKIYLSVIITFLTISLAYGQDTLLDTKADSLLVIESVNDSLDVQSILDSLSNSETQVKINRQAYLNLIDKVENYKTTSRETFIADNNKQLYWSIQGHLFGMASDNYQIRKDNFTELNSIYPSYLKLQNYNRFYSENYKNNFVKLRKDYYDLPVTLIEVVASTGDYDLGTGYFALRKNEFLDTFNLDFRMNFAKAGFYSGNELASNTSSNLIIPFANSSLDIAFNSVAYEGPYHRLSPAFMLKTTIFEENSQSFSSIYNNKYLSLGLKYSTENYKGASNNTLKREFFQILLNKEILTNHWFADLNYEYFIHQEDFYSQEINALSSDIDQLLDFSLVSTYEKFNTDNRLLITFPYQIMADNELSYNLLDNYKISLFNNFKETLAKENIIEDYSTQSDSGVNQELNHIFYYLNEKNNSGLAVNYQSSYLELGLSLSNSQIKSKLINTDYKNDFQALKTNFTTKFKHSYGKYAVKLTSNMKFYQDYENNNIHYIPKAILSNSLEIARDVNHNNFIKAGLSHHYFDSYLSFDNEEEILNTDSSLLDLYLGFQITKQFEIIAYWKNILDNQIITGYRTIPQSITVFLSWNFLN